jgi:hypothetical protein
MACRILQVGIQQEAKKHLHLAPANTLSLNVAARWRDSCCSPMILMDHFAVDNFNPFKNFVFYYAFGQSLLLVPDVKT